MIDPGYVRAMARYNAWQNAQLTDILADVAPGIATQDRGAFFVSILGTLNHLLWGDAMWMSRFAPKLVAPPDSGLADSPGLCPTVAAWSAERFRMDGRITRWAAAVGAIDLKGDLNWYSGVLGREVSRPLGGLVVHFFNHQTHHRGQVHAMLTAAGLGAPVSDLFLMPEETG